MTRLFVAGYPRDATKDDVLQLFRQFGVTEEAIVFPRDRRTRRKKGFAYITLADERANEAITTLNEFAVGTAQLTVRRAEERPPNRRRF
ncbi:MAG: hypothetical protein NVS1B14_06100 [Vulcanimicrobiaceae bacterium]